MVAWWAGKALLVLSRGEIGEENINSGCRTTNLAFVSLRLTNTAPGVFWLVESSLPGNTGNVVLFNFKEEKWGDGIKIGDGDSAEVFTDPKGRVSVAWCGIDHKLNYLPKDGNVEEISYSSCGNRPSMFSDSTGRIHIVFAANQWEDNFGNKRQGNALMETIRQPDGWTEPAFITQLTPGGQQEVVQLANGDVELAG
jgi:hypothetical protein